MNEGNERRDINRVPGGTRRIVVQDSTPGAPSSPARGRRLQDPPNTNVPSHSPPPERNRGTLSKPFPIRRSYLLVGLGAGVVLLVLSAGVLVALRKPGKGTPEPEAIQKTPTVASAIAPPNQPDELHQVEASAKEVIRQISRDSKPYSFSERAVEDIQARVRDHSQSHYLSGSLLKLQENTGSISTRAGKEGLQASLVILVALALTKGGQNGDPVIAATRVLPSLASLNRTFGSGEADSCLILIAAFPEGAGTNRSHPLLRRIKLVVTNPLTERNIWYLHDRNVLANEAYDLVVDTIAYGIIARSPRQFGLDNDPLSF